MQLNNSILNELGLDSEEFLYNDHVMLYKSNDIKPFGQVSFDNGHFRLTVGRVDSVKGIKHIVS